MSAAARLRCDIFCRVVDNFGDAAVCWRLARALQSEHGMAVRLLIDRPEVLAALRPELDPALEVQALDGVRIERVELQPGTAQSGGPQPRAGKRPRWPDVADIAIDAFGGGLPAGYAEALAARRPAGTWIVLEYLSAEAWVAGHHRVASPHPALSVRRFFFFPGFAADTGGLLRERGLIEAREAFDRDAQARTRFWAALGQPEPTPGCRVVSLFGYANAALPDLLDAMVRAGRPTLLALAAGPLAADVRHWLHARGLPFAGAAGETVQAGPLQVRALQFLAQPDYDRLLWASDLNFVRGEDSLVRAIWAGRPLVWHLYPQADAAHCAKLAAFQAVYRAAVAAPSAADGADARLEALAALEEVQCAWNGCAAGAAAAGTRGVHAGHDSLGTRDLARDPHVAGPGPGDPFAAWLAVDAALPTLAEHARRFGALQAGVPDLAARLAAFAQETLK